MTRPTAEERVRELFEYPVGDLDDCDRAASATLLCNMMRKHAQAEVEAATAAFMRLLETRYCDTHRNEIGGMEFRAFVAREEETGCPWCLKAQVERLRATLRNARAAIADIYCHVNEDRYQRAMRAMHLVAREIEVVLAPEAKEGE